MDPLRILMRMAKLAQNPPGEKRIKLMLVIFAIIAVLFGIELLFGWPEWLTPSNNLRRLR